MNDIGVDEPKDSLFRSSRPDSIETLLSCGQWARSKRLFRSSRPDSIETRHIRKGCHHLADCSGLLGRTPLRQGAVPGLGLGVMDCSGLLGRTPLRLNNRLSVVRGNRIVPVF